MGFMTKMVQAMEHENENKTSIWDKKNIKSSLCNYSDAYIFVTGDITATNGDENTDVAFRNRAPFTKCITHMNDEKFDTAGITIGIGITMPMYNLIEYKGNYLDASGNLWQFKRV